MAGRSTQRNRHQKAAFRPGERRVSRVQVDALLQLATSEDADERLTAATYLCPCHVRGRGDAEWQAVLRLMEDADRRVRFAAWHTLEDGGLPGDDEAIDLLEPLYARESAPRVRRMAAQSMAPLLAERDRRARAAMMRPAPPLRGRCDLCSDRNVLVTLDHDIPIPAAGATRPALVCRPCAGQ